MFYNSVTDAHNISSGVIIEVFNPDSQWNALWKSQTSGIALRLEHYAWTETDIHTISWVMVKIKTTSSRWDSRKSLQQTNRKRTRQFWQPCISCWISTRSTNGISICTFLPYGKGFSGLQESPYDDAIKPVRDYKTGITVARNGLMNAAEWLKQCLEIAKTG